MFFGCVKAGESIIETFVLKFLVLQIACANGKCNKNTSIMKPNSIPKSIANPFENDARKSDAKMKENCANMESKKGANI